MTANAPEQEPSIEEILASIRQIISDDDEDSPKPAAKAEPEAAPVAASKPAEPKEDVLVLSDPIIEDEDEDGVDELGQDDDDDPIAKIFASLGDDDASAAPVEIDLRDAEAETPVVEEVAPEPVVEPKPTPVVEAAAPVAAAKAPEVVAPQTPTAKPAMAPVTPPAETVPPVAAPSVSSTPSAMPQANIEVDEESVLGEVAASATFAGFSRLATNIAVDRRRQADGGVTIEDIVREMLQPMLRQWMDENLPSLVERMVQKELEKLAQRALDD